MSKSKKKKRTSPAPSEAGVNTLGIDIEPAELNETEAGAAELSDFEVSDAPAGFELPEAELDRNYDQPLPLVEKIINYATLSLSMLLLGGSIVFWWVIGKYLLTDPSRLADSGQMRAILICCAILPVVVTAAQVILRRPLSTERWLICMCISGAAAALLVVIYQMGIRGDEFGFADYFSLLCCTVSGCTLPSALCVGVRWLFPVISAKIKASRAAHAEEDTEWSSVSEDVCSMTDFDL